MNVVVEVDMPRKTIVDFFKMLHKFIFSNDGFRLFEKDRPSRIRISVCYSILFQQQLDDYVF